MPGADDNHTRVHVIAAVAGGLVIVLYVSAYFLIAILGGGDRSLVETLTAFGPADCAFLLAPIVPILFTVGMLFVPGQGRVARALSWALYGLSLAFLATVAILISQFRDCGMALGMGYLIACFSLGAPVALLFIGWLGARFIFERPTHSVRVTRDSGVSQEGMRARSVPNAHISPMSWPMRAGLLALAATLYALAFSVPALWRLVFVALVPALVATDGLRPWAAFKWGTRFGFVVAALGVTWFWNIFGPGAPALWMIFGLWFGVFFAGRSIMQRGLRPWVALLATALWWTAVEFFRAECYPLRCTFLCLGHALAGETSPFKLGARLLGAYGLGTAVIAVNVGIAYAVRQAGTRRLTALIGAACALAVLALLPAALEPPTDSPGRAVRVALVQNEPGRLDESVRLSRSAASAGPQWILWPELSILSDVKADARMRGEIEKLARDSGAVVGVGAKLNHPTAAPDFWNAYVLFGPGGESLGEYHKMQPVPLMRDGVPGSDYKVFDTPHGRLGVAICYDADFAWICRRLVANGAEVLAVPILDPEHWGARMRRQHVAATVLRAIENGRYVLRIANAGPTLIIDPAGSIVERREETSPGVVSGRIFPRDGRTPYARFGWLLPYACQGASVVLLVWAVIAGRRKNV